LTYAILCHKLDAGEIYRVKGYFEFVDLEKVFTWLRREVIRWTICGVDVDEWLVSAVLSVYVDARTVVRTIHGYSDCFEVRVGMHNAQY